MPRMAQAVLMLAWVIPASAQTSVLTYQYDLSRAGANRNEVALTPANVNVNQFGKLFSYPVDGYVYAQPLYLPNVSVPGKGTHNIVFVATEHDSVYAFDADGPGGPAAGPLWKVSFVDPAAGITSVPASDTGCGQIVPEIGITGTPVIDPKTGTLYVVAMTKEKGSYVHRLHALDVATGQERAGSPVVIQASSPGTGDGGSVDRFIPRNYKQRPGLLLLNGVVYTAWSSHCDIGTYHGWLIGYDAQTLAQVSVFNSTPNGGLGSFWAGGAAPAVDADSNIYVVSANGSWNRATGGPDLGESYIKLGSSGGLPVLDYFTPFNQKALNDADVDTGSAGVALLGDEAGSPAHPHLMVGAGKEGRIYVLDRDHLGGWQAGSDSQIVQSIPGAISGLFGNPAYFNNTVYFCGSGDGVMAFPIANAQMAPASSRSVERYGYPGCVPSISSNGATKGIVWTLESGPALHAYDAANLANELFHTGQNAARDGLDSYVKYTAPTVVNGKVYAATQTALVAYALLAPPGGTLGISSAASGDPSEIAPGSIVSIYGQGLATATAAAPNYPIPAATVAGASVTMNGWPAPVFFASPTQLNVQAPFEISGPVSVVARVNGAPVNSGNISVQPAAPSVFLIGQGHAAALNGDNSVNSAARPAATGSVISVYATGLGAVTPALATGVAAAAAPVSNANQGVTATIGGQPATVNFAGGAPGYAGLDQINVVVPALAPGEYPLQIAVGNVTSNTATVSVR